MKVINVSDSMVAVQGVTIPAGQHRTVKDFDPDNPRNDVLIAEGRIQVPDLEVQSQRVDDAPDEDSEDEDSAPRRFWNSL